MPWACVASVGAQLTVECWSQLRQFWAWYSHWRERESSNPRPDKKYNNEILVCVAVATGVLDWHCLRFVFLN